MSPEYWQYLVERHEEEACGERFFQTLHDKTADYDRRYKWKVLAQLERETRERIETVLVAANIPINVRTAKLMEAEGHGVTLALTPWGELMARFRPAVQRAMDSFAEAERLANGNKQAAELLRRITQHEAAYLEFVDRELQAPHQNSLEPVIALISSVPGY